MELAERIADILERHWGEHPVGPRACLCDELAALPEIRDILAMRGDERPVGVVGQA